MKVGVIAGNFDVIHPGYIEMFTECARNCDKLIVLLQEDPTIERPDKCKPILTVDERIKILMSLRQINQVMVYNLESELYNTLNKIKPDVRFLGEDYIGRSFTGDDLNIPIVYLDRSHGWSTTKFKNLIANSLKH
jgi:glycerol-3-phosphate cytidylyltransferase